ncbi:unnamed protein product, partial [Allacma fusca]
MVTETMGYNKTLLHPPFKNIQSLVLVECARDNLKFGVKEVEIEKRLKNWFRGAKDRNGGRRKQQCLSRTKQRMIRKRINEIVNPSIKKASLPSVSHVTPNSNSKNVINFDSSNADL